MESLVPKVSSPALLLVALLATPLACATESDVPLRLAQADREEAARQAAAERAAAETGGKVLSAEPEIVDGKPVYRVKVLTPDGHVKTVVIEAGAR